jgi:dissimilatory sulfite reductase (desulfoviridin) alpha/beta subunit
LVTLEREDQVMSVIEKIIHWVYRRAWSGRLLSEQLDDLHFEKFRQEIVHEVSEKIARI